MAVCVIWMGLEWARPGTTATSPIPTNLAELPAGLAAVWLLVRVLGSVITAPIAEELAFRGYLLRRLLAADFEEPSTSDSDSDSDRGRGKGAESRDETGERRRRTGSHEPRKDGRGRARA